VTGPVLAMAVPLERLQAIAWWNLQIAQASRGIEDGELAEGRASEASKPPHRPPLEEGLGVAATKRPDHTVTLPPPNVGTPGSGTGRRRSLSDMAACVPPLTSATPRHTPPQHWPPQRQDRPMPPTPSPTYERLRETIAKRMCMSNAYQPLMLMELLGHGFARQQPAHPPRRT
jgi:hypothetical protein